MSAGLFGLLDDIAALARIAAASVDDVGAAAGRASAKAAGVVVDDTAVTPQFMEGSPAQRELPIIRKIAVGSLRNKLLFILPAALLLSQFAQWALPLLLIAGGTFLAYEGAEKIWARLSGHGTTGVGDVDARGEFTAEHEKDTVSGAIRTDFILSAEIMVIALKEVVDSAPGAGFWMRAVVLTLVAVLITLAVYGVVALIVKMDDIGLSLAGRRSPASRRFGRMLVTAMPKVLDAISIIGTAAMLWVGGHILLMSLHELSGFDLLDGSTVGSIITAPYDLVHHWEEGVHGAVQGWLGSTLGWLVNTVASAVVGLVIGAVVVAIHQVLSGGHEQPSPGDEHVPH